MRNNSELIAAATLLSLFCVGCEWIPNQPENSGSTEDKNNEDDTDGNSDSELS